MWSLWLGTPVSNGSPRRSKPPYPNPFGRFQFTHTGPASWLGKRGGNGRTLTASWSNCGPHILYFRRSCAVTGCKCSHRTCCRSSRVGGSAPSLGVTGRNKDDDGPRVVHLPYVNIFLGFLPPSIYVSQPHRGVECASPHSVFIPTKEKRKPSGPRPCLGPRSTFRNRQWRLSVKL